MKTNDMKDESEFHDGVVVPDLVLNMKRVWFAKVWNGEKTVEYREKKPYWDRRIDGWAGQSHLVKFVEMRLGYASGGPVMLLRADGVDVGPCPYEGWDGEYYRIHFAVVGRYMKDSDGIIFPALDFQKKETRNEDA